MAVTDIYLDGDYLASNPSWDVEDSPWKAAQVATMLEKNRIVPATIGEVGCGAGAVLAELQRRYPRARLKGFDISPQAIELSQSRANATLSFECADLAAGTDEHFDLLLAIDVVEHVDDYPGFLRSIGGLADRTVFHIPLEMTVLNTVFKGFILKQRRKVGHLHYFMKETALAALEESGYRVADWCYTPGYSLPRDYGWKDRLLRVPRRLCYPLGPDLTARVLGGYSLLVLAEPAP